MDDTIKDSFYNQLQEVLAAIPQHDHLFMVGDYNAQLDGDRAGFESTIGPHEVGVHMTDNGDRLCSFCTTNDLCVGNTFFQHKRAHKTTWRAPGRRYENKIDFVCVRRWWRSSFLDVRWWRGTDAGLDHHLLIAKCRLRLMRTVSNGQHPKPFDTFGTLWHVL